MGFTDRYIASIGSSNLMDDALHHQTDPLAAAALAGDVGALLCRVKYADGTLNRMFEGNQQNLAQLLRIWTVEVIKRGRSRRWVPENTAWHAAAAQALYRKFGFEVEGVLRDYALRDGRFVDTVSMARLRQSA